MTIEVLLDDGVNPFMGCKDGITSMLLLMGDGINSANDLVRENFSKTC